MIGEFNILVAGVGGQGALLTGRILSLAAFKEGIKVVSGEVHGMSQRGGAITAHVRIGEKVHGPIIPSGRANVLLGLELIEPLRYIEFASKKSTVLMSKRSMIPPIVWITKGITYPGEEEVVRNIKPFVENFFILDSFEIARQAGSTLTANTVMLGALAEIAGLPFSKEALIESVRENVPQREVEINIKAFNMGSEEIRKLSL